MDPHPRDDNAVDDDPHADRFDLGFDAARKQAEEIVHTSHNLLQAAARIRRMTADVAR